MPQREMVAGDAYCKSKTSKSIVEVGKLSRMRSPLGSVSSLLSSMTEFMFSTHTASTSPSYTMYRRSGLSSGTGLFMSRKMLERRPSVQSRVAGSRLPYSSEMGCAFGLITNCFEGMPVMICARRSDARHAVLPPPVGPTIIVVWRVNSVSYNWMTLSNWMSSSFMPNSVIACSTASLKEG